MAFDDVIGYVLDGYIACPDCTSEEDAKAEETGAIFKHSESDSPEHCGDCGAFLGGSLTADGYKDLVERIRDFDFEYWPDLLEEYMDHWGGFDWYVLPTFAGPMHPLIKEIKYW